MSRDSHHALRKALLGGALLVVLSSTATLAIASRRIAAEQAAYSAPSAGRCTPVTPNGSAVLPGTSLAVSPLPDSYSASPSTQISLLGAPPSALHDIRVSGSVTGSHAGRLHAYSQGDGGSFVLARPFLAGETVIVRGRVDIHSRSQRFAYRFVIAHEDTQLEGSPAASPSSGRDQNEMQHFHSSPELQAPVLVVTAHSPQTAPGDMFAAPYAGPGPERPDDLRRIRQPRVVRPAAGEHRRHQPAGAAVRRQAGADLVAGAIPPEGFGQGEEIIDNTSYQQMARVRAGNGYRADLHEFRITPAGHRAADRVRPDLLQPLLRAEDPAAAR